jgi:hypothetical protein
MEVSVQVSMSIGILNNLAASDGIDIANALKKFH